MPAKGLQSPAQLAGRDWKGFGPKEKEAYLAGFIAGAAAVRGNSAEEMDTTPSKAMMSCAQRRLTVSVFGVRLRISDRRLLLVGKPFGCSDRRCNGQNQFSAAITLIRVARRGALPVHAEVATETRVKEARRKVLFRSLRDQRIRWRSSFFAVLVSRFSLALEKQA